MSLAVVASQKCTSKVPYLMLLFMYDTSSHIGFSAASIISFNTFPIFFSATTKVLY